MKIARVFPTKTNMCPIDPFDWIVNYGDKVHSEENIKKLCPCDDEAFKMYRY